MKLIQRLFVHAAVMLTGSLALISARRPESLAEPRYAEEAKAPAFSDEFAALVSSKVDWNTKCIDIESTKDKWLRVERKAAVAGNSDRSVPGSTVLSAVSTQRNNPVSVGGSPTFAACSANVASGGNGTICSVLSGADRYCSTAANGASGPVRECAIGER
jgi:hypothetical protein